MYDNVKEWVQMMWPQPYPGPLHWRLHSQLSQRPQDWGQPAPRPPKVFRWPKGWCPPGALPLCCASRQGRRWLVGVPEPVGSLVCSERLALRMGALSWTAGLGLLLCQELGSCGSWEREKDQPMRPCMPAIPALWEAEAHPSPAWATWRLSLKVKDF